ncbi:MAG: putative membrane protein YczE [Paracoccaceae bacterium]|jgi:uncharacterized membrane protein YczE
MPFTLKFLKIKTVPTLFWSAPKTLSLRPPLVSLVFLVFGLSIFGLGEAMLITAGIGVSPWTVFAQGLTHFIGIGIGLATFVLSISVLLSWIPLKQTPGIGTLANAVIIAWVLEFALPYLPHFDHTGLQILQAILGVLFTGLGGAIYLIANLGPGPRDGLMTGLQRATSRPLALVRASIEISVILLGWSLGGTVGIGTMFFALGIGPSVAASLYGLQKLFAGRT